MCLGAGGAVMPWRHWLRGPWQAAACAGAVSIPLSLLHALLASGTLAACMGRAAERSCRGSTCRPPAPQHSPSRASNSSAPEQCTTHCARRQPASWEASPAPAPARSAPTGASSSASSADGGRSASSSSEPRDAGASARAGLRAEAGMGRVESRCDLAAACAMQRGRGAWAPPAAAASLQGPGVDYSQRGGPHSPTSLCTCILLIHGQVDVCALLQGGHATQRRAGQALWCAHQHPARPQPPAC
jgi:hypothetical protein